MEAFKTVIKNYLDNRAKEDSLFAETYKKKGKTIEGCVNYIYSQAKKMLAKGGNAVGVEDATVYGWAVHYYDEDNINVENVEERVEVTSPSNIEALSEKTVEKKQVRKKTRQELFDERQLSLFAFE